MERFMNFLIIRTWRTLQAICACYQICRWSTWYPEISSTMVILVIITCDGCARDTYHLCARRVTELAYYYFCQKNTFGIDKKRHFFIVKTVMHCNVSIYFLDLKKYYLINKSAKVICKAFILVKLSTIVFGKCDI